MKLNTTHKVWIGVGIAVVLLLVWFVSMYNSLVSSSVNVDNSWGNVQASYQRRFDLIPNLVNTVKGYAAHETELFERITALRSQWSTSKSVDDQVKASNALDSAVSRLLLVAENYPDLKANTNFLALQDELAGTENRINVARRDYNEAVRVFNTRVQVFPTNILASSFGFKEKTFFQAEAGSEKAVKVSFEK